MGNARPRKRYKAVMRKAPHLLRRRSEELAVSECSISPTRKERHRRTQWRCVAPLPNAHIG
ncbi:hypothetical protein MUK42_04779 [Musa troglodytarum]|uniref:Uncharacterized protein n=1 Tax=Musa troglodytarum TaxID=320322 RepID=A0A9E7KKM8_9LILI|nr:hypothetical protein MUK42_04779 [Musa troglodytarum]